jgi:flagellar basal body-associated protein FliL
MGPLVDLGGQIIVNLRGIDGRSRLLRTSLQIEVDSEETRREVESKIIVIRYKLTRLLSARRPEEVIGATQMEQVRENMKRAADAVLKSKGKVVNVWPNDWILE